MGASLLLSEVTMSSSGGDKADFIGLELEAQAAPDQASSEGGAAADSGELQTTEQCASSAPKSTSSDTSSPPGPTSASPARERLERPAGEPIISGPLEVALSLSSEWKRRFITVVGDGLYIWTSHRFVAFRARL